MIDECRGYDGRKKTSGPYVRHVRGVDDGVESQDARSDKSGTPMTCKSEWSSTERRNIEV
jgi:hypothetical protein